MRRFISILILLVCSSLASAQECNCTDCNCSKSVTVVLEQPTLAPILPLVSGALIERVREVRPVRSVLMSSAMTTRTVIQRTTNRVRFALRRVRNLCNH